MFQLAHSARAQATLGCEAQVCFDLEAWLQDTSGETTHEIALTLELMF